MISDVQTRRVGTERNLGHSLLAAGMWLAVFPDGILATDADIDLSSPWNMELGSQPSGFGSTFGHDSG